MRSASDKLIRKMKTMKTLLLCCILLTAAAARPADMHYGKRKCHSMAAILVKCSPQPDSAYAPSLPAGT